MSDISRNNMHDIVLRDNKLKRQHFGIILNEKKNQIKQLDVTLDRIKSVEVQKIELQKQTLQKEIEALSVELRDSKPITAEIISKKEK